MAGARWQPTLAAVCACVALVAGCGSEETPRVESVDAIGFVERFAPLVGVHANEPLPPVSADRFLDHSTLYWVNGRGRREAVAAGQMAGGDAPRVLEAFRLGRDSEEAAYSRTIGKRPGCAPCDTAEISADHNTRPFGTERSFDFLREAEGYVLDFEPSRRASPKQDTIPVYTTTDEREQVAGSPLWVTYYMLFEGERRNGQPGETNEGDWERIAVLLSRKDGGRRYAPELVRYYRDGRRTDVPWEEVEVTKGGPGKQFGTHPVIHVTLGDHTPQPGSCEGCREWRTWGDVINADTEPWWAFGGAWGDVGADSASTGPLGPSFYLDP